MGKPRKWSKRRWVDVFSGPQFRTYSSPRKFQLCLTIESYQGDGVFHFSVHLMNRALAFEFPYRDNRPNPGIHWVLFKGKRT